MHNLHGEKGLLCVEKGAHLAPRSGPILNGEGCTVFARRRGDVLHIEFSKILREKCTHFARRRVHNLH